MLALFAFGGNDGGDAELGDAGLDIDGGFDADVEIDASTGASFSGDGGVGDITALFRRIPVSSYAFFLSFFGGAGMAGTWVGVGFIATIILAVSLGLIAAAVNTAAFSFLRATDTSSQLTDRQIEGRMATVSVPIDAGKRGRVWFDTGEERIQLTAGSIDDDVESTFGRGDQVVIVAVTNGVAKVMAVDPDLAD